MVGVNLRSVSEKANSILVRVGGGYTPLETFVNEYGRQECFRVWHDMEKFGLSFEDTIVKHLERNKAEKQIVTNFVKDSKSQDYAMFSQIMLAIRINQVKKAQQQAETRRASVMVGGSRSSMSGRASMSGAGVGAPRGSVMLNKASGNDLRKSLAGKSPSKVGKSPAGSGIGGGSGIGSGSKRNSFKNSRPSSFAER